MKHKNKKMHPVRYLLASLVVALGLATLVGSNVTENLDPDGIWYGAITDSGGTYDLTGLIFHNRLVYFSLLGGYIYTANVGMTGDQLSATANMLQIGGSSVGTANVAATVVEQVSIDGTYTSTIPNSGAISQTFYSVYNRTPDLSVVAGTFTVTDGVAYTWTITVLPDGSFTGSDTDGCTYDGTLVPGDGVHNIYKMAINISGCISFKTAGYAFIDDNAVANDTLWMIIDDPTYVLITTMSRV